MRKQYLTVEAVVITKKIKTTNGGIFIMANDGWFRCENCGKMVKVLVPDHVKVLTVKCDNCGGTYKKT